MTKIMSFEEPSAILSRIVSEDHTEEGLEFYFAASEGIREIRTRVNAALFAAYHSELQKYSAPYERAERDDLAYAFDRARDGFEMQKLEFESWIEVNERWFGEIKGFTWDAIRRKAASAAMEVVRAARKMAAAHRALRFDPHGKTFTPQPA